MQHVDTLDSWNGYIRSSRSFSQVQYDGGPAFALQTTPERQVSFHMEHDVCL
jgi:hypothetical protein